MFVGRFEHSLDEKGRLVLPASYRSAFGEPGFLTQYERCLGLWTAAGFADVTSRLTGKVREGLAPNDAIRAFSSNAVEVKVDKAGRISIPDWLREKAGVGREAMVVGVLDRIEIWDVQRWADVSAGADDALVRAVSDLGI